MTIGSVAVPIHPLLIKFGWLDYTRGPNARLFDGKRNERAYPGGSFENFSARANRLLKGLAIKQEKNARNSEGKKLQKNFHSCRHSFINELRNELKAPENVILALGGHSDQDKGVSISVYTADVDLRELAKWVGKIRFEGLIFNV